MNDRYFLLLKSLPEIPGDGMEHFIPWRRYMLYEIEPTLQDIAKRALSQKGRPFYARLNAYTEAKHSAEYLLGWYARDPRLRSSGAWDCYFRYILRELDL